MSRTFTRAIEVRFLLEKVRDMPLESGCMYTAYGVVSFDFCLSPSSEVLVYFVCLGDQFNEHNVLRVAFRVLAFNVVYPLPVTGRHVHSDRLPAADRCRYKS